MALLAPALLYAAQGGQGQVRAKKHRAKAAAKAPKPAEKPKLSQAELLAPYSAMSREKAGPANAASGQGGNRPDLQDSYQSNATSWKLDLSLDPKRLQDDSPLRFRLGREQKAVDPLTHKELTPRADPLKAQQSLKDLDLKGVLENVGGKAEVQVDVLKF
ncbi:MAG: hypothetical protein A2051_13835 [Desulfovibrionales bacterium GWA2_65_9]|nr:MAG: hypothetical protein A2051_13835 [Desulfovibrionales bacterium GWA2_65_9]